MRYSTVAIVIFLLASVQLFAQQEQSREGQATVVIRQEAVVKQHYYSVRAGLWFPKDWEKGFKFKDVSVSKDEGDIDQSQAFGLDFHFRRNVGYPVYVDLAVSGWYSSYTYKLKEFSSRDILSADSWMVVIPLTLGVSVAPIPDSPFQPYAMVGIGGYFGLTGRELKITRRNESEDDFQIRFGWYYGLGLDVFLSSELGVSAAVKYQNIEFERELYTGQKNLTGIQALLGIVMKM